MNLICQNLRKVKEKLRVRLQLMATLIALISRQHGMHHHAFLFSS